MQKIVYPVIGTQVQLPFYLTGIGVSEPESSVKREKGLVSHQLLFTRSGTGRLVVDGCSYIQKAGSQFYLSPGIPHEYYPEGGDWTTCWVVFRGEFLSELMKTLGFLPFMASNDTNRESLQNLFNMILAAANDPVSCGIKSSELLYRYILIAREMLVQSPANGRLSGSIIENAVRYMDSCFYEDITLEQLAAKANVSFQHFCRVFKAQIGMRPMEYLARRRISEAKILLYNTALSVAEIGRKIGYCDQTYFGMVFKKYEGVSPAVFRKLKNTIAI